MNKQEVFEACRERALTRANKWEVIEVDRFPPLGLVDEPAYCGICVRSLLKSKKRYILKEAVVKPFGVPQAYTDVSRDYLDVRFPHRLRAYAAQRDEFCKKRVAPHYAQKGIYTNMLYFDLSAAYASIMGVIGWNCDYWPGKFLSPGDVPYDFPLLTDRRARLCLVSSGIAMTAKYWDGHKISVKHMANKHVNYGLWACVIDTLNMIAMRARELDAVYCNTDGFILPFDNVHILSDYVANFGLTWKTKGAGNCVVFSQQAYAIGGRRTKTSGVQRVAVVDNIAYADYSNLEKHLTQIAKWRQSTGILTKSGIRESYRTKSISTRNLANFAL